MVGLGKFCVSITLKLDLWERRGSSESVFGGPQGIDPLFHLNSLEGFKIGLVLTLLFSVWFVLCFGPFFIFVVEITVFNCFCLFLFSFFARILIF